MRLFVAAPVHREVEIFALQAIQRLRYGPADYKWAERTELHVTLGFIGERTRDQLPPITAMLRKLAAETAPFEVGYGAIGAFDTLADPRVIWIGVDDLAGELARLALAVGRDDPREFIPHVTLGYRKGEYSPPEMPAFIQSQPAAKLRGPIRSLGLYGSRPPGLPPLYERLVEFPLLGGGGAAAP